LGTLQDITERKTAEQEQRRLIKRLQTALDEIKTLRGIIPICSFCKRIRDDEGFWNQVVIYIPRSQRCLANYERHIPCGSHS
jgi:PAS domain-containing protein